MKMAYGWVNPNQQYNKVGTVKNFMPEPVATTKKSSTSSSKPKSQSTPAVTAPSTPTANTGLKVSDLGLQTGYDTPAWYTDEWDRQRQNAQQYANAGIQYELKADPKTGLPSITYAQGQNIGAIDADPTGGTYDYYGYSNNPNFLKATIGLTRDQINQDERLAGLSDRALYEIYSHGQQSYNPITGGIFENGWLGTGLYWNPYDSGVGFGGGGISSVNGANAVSVTDVRKALAELTGQKENYAETELGGWWGGTPIPFVKADYYGDNSNRGARQQTEIIDPFVQRMLSSRNNTAQNNAPATPSEPTNNNIVQTILRKNRELEERERKYKEGY